MGAAPSISLRCWFACCSMLHSKPPVVSWYAWSAYNGDVVWGPLPCVLCGCGPSQGVCLLNGGISLTKLGFYVAHADRPSVLTCFPSGFLDLNDAATHVVLGLWQAQSCTGGTGTTVLTCQLSWIACCDASASSDCSCCIAGGFCAVGGRSASSAVSLCHWL